MGKKVDIDNLKKAICEHYNNLTIQADKISDDNIALKRLTYLEQSQTNQELITDNFVSMAQFYDENFPNLKIFS